MEKKKIFRKITVPGFFKVLTFSFFIIIVLFFCVKGIWAQDSSPSDQQITPTPTQSPVSDEELKKLQDKIKEYEEKVTELQGQAKTLSSQIAIMDNQINATQLRINETEKQIANLLKDIKIAKGKILLLEKEVNESTKALLGRIVAVYKVGRIDPWHIFMTSNSNSSFMTRLSYLKFMEMYDKKNVYSTEQAKVDYANLKGVYEEKQKEQELLSQKLKNYTIQLDNEKKSKEELLKETQGSEASYQSLLAQTQAQLAALSNFARSRVGIGGGIIPHEDISDGWGKYYNQRDANWGNNLIGLSREQVWEVGCLLTSYAMVVSHFGGALTPADVAANSDNFSLSTALFKKPGSNANGHGVRSSDNPSLADLRNAINSGGIVIAGLSSNGGPFPTHYSDHWVVLRSVDGDSFRINDPWYKGAVNVPLNDHYSGWTIIEARIYN